MQASRTEFAQARNGRHKRRGSGLRTYVIAVRSVDGRFVVPACPVPFYTSVCFTYYTFVARILICGITVVAVDTVRSPVGALEIRWK